MKMMVVQRGHREFRTQELDRQTDQKEEGERGRTVQTPRRDGRSAEMYDLDADIMLYRDAEGEREG